MWPMKVSIEGRETEKAWNLGHAVPIGMTALRTVWQKLKLVPNASLNPIFRYIQQVCPSPSQQQRFQFGPPSITRAAPGAAARCAATISWPHCWDQRSPAAAARPGCDRLVASRIYWLGHPSHPIFKGWQVYENWTTKFQVELPKKSGIQAAWNATAPRIPPTPTFRSPIRALRAASCFSSPSKR